MPSTHQVPGSTSTRLVVQTPESPASGRWRQESANITLGWTACCRLAWATWDPVYKQKQTSRCTRLGGSFFKKAPTRPPRMLPVSRVCRGDRARCPPCAGGGTSVPDARGPDLREAATGPRCPGRSPSSEATSAGRGPRRPRSLSPGSPPAAPRLHSRVVITHGQQQAAEEPHVGVQPRGRHVPHMLYHTHPARRHRGSASS